MNRFSKGDIVEFDLLDIDPENDDSCMLVSYLGRAQGSHFINIIETGEKIHVTRVLPEPEYSHILGQECMDIPTREIRLVGIC